MPIPGVQVRQGNNLPHWTREGATYSVTFRLADSLPAAAADRIRLESAQLDRNVKLGDAPTLDELKRLARLKSDLVENALHAGLGDCLLRRDDCALLVADALRHFDQKRYALLAWCVMPNHVHVVFRVFESERLDKILHSWKSFTAKEIGKLVGRGGQIWQSESYDHLVRDQADLNHCIQYVLENPIRAGLADWPWVWPVEERKVRPTSGSSSSAGIGPEARSTDRPEADSTPRTL